MAAATLWSNLVFLGDGTFKITMTREMLGRKDKFGMEETFIRRPFKGRSTISCKNPVHLPARFRVLVLESCDINQFQYPLNMCQLPTEKPKILGSAEMRRWLIYTAKETFNGLPRGLNPRGRRNGSSTMAYRLLKDESVFAMLLIGK